MRVKVALETVGALLSESLLVQLTFEFDKNIFIN